MYNVVLKMWKSGEGFSYSEDFDTTDFTDAEKYAKAYDSNADDYLADHIDGDAAMVEIWDEDNKVSEFWLEKEEE